MGNYMSESQYCNSDGRCLKKISNNFYYVSSKFFCLNNCQAIPCANNIVCDKLMPKYLLDEFDQLCTVCYNAFGKHVGGNGRLEKKEIDECPICYDENVFGISNPKCNHFMCINCFKTCYNNILNEIKPDIEPPFPYSQDIYQIYLDEPHNEIWGHYNEIVQWELDYNTWSNRQNSYRKLDRCPICRK
jgi:hypothetical protein